MGLGMGTEGQDGCVVLILLLASFLTLVLESPHVYQF